MPHINAPLSPTGRLHMVLRHPHDGIPKAHVAAESRVSRPTVVTWVARYLESGEAGLADLSSAPHTSRTRASAAVVELIEALRRGCFLVMVATPDRKLGHDSTTERP